jgi:hypothetical protein
MIGTTRSRVRFFMDRFRKLRFIHYNGGLQVRSSVLISSCTIRCSPRLHSHNRRSRLGYDSTLN